MKYLGYLLLFLAITRSFFGFGALFEAGDYLWEYMGDFAFHVLLLVYLLII